MPRKIAVFFYVKNPVARRGMENSSNYKLVTINCVEDAYKLQPGVR